MQEMNENVLDLARFRLNKQNAMQTKEPESFHSTPKLSSANIENHMENIKHSIQRINKLMAELKSISDKPNN